MVNTILHILKVNIFAAACILAVILLSRVFKGRYSVRWKYTMWLLISLFLMFPVNISNERAVVRLEIRQQDNTPGTVHHTVGNTPLADVSQVQEKEAGLSGNTYEQKEPALTLTDILTYFCYIWLTGFLFLAFGRLISYYRSLDRLRRWGMPVKNSKITKIYRAACTEKHIKRVPKLMMNPRVQSPVLAGLGRTYLYLPDVPYTDRELELILKHELFHYRHKDLWYKMFLLIVDTVYWFNPLLHWMIREADKDIEYICDCYVIAGYPKSDHAVYNRLLLKTAASGNSHYLTASLNDSKAAFKERIWYMMKAAKLRKGIIPILMLTFVLVVANVLVGCSVNKNEGETDAPSAPVTGKVQSGSDTGVKDTSSADQGEKTGEKLPKPEQTREAKKTPEQTLDVQQTPEAETTQQPEVITADEEKDSPEDAEVPAENHDRESAVSAKVQLYEGTYFDSVVTGFDEEKVVDGLYIEDDYCEVDISDITDTSFDFTAYKVGGMTGERSLIFKKHTAEFADGGTRAVYNGDEYTLYFEFPDNHASHPVVTDIVISGFPALEAATFVNNNIPGYGFS
ncbi:M56 family metallopeptidase [Ruminococcus sp. OA3]|uniref:M56 family metallopeptidase n=1 Tax=Ruminococcus sp. OA3 TaxID=2914164 RepID=UPI001F06013F|nr:M56 family metallopeptidase [Ruminococcus sp. OA3]MCH1982315.1 M56 family metallopeptidase [Ruminococcus sp. OA3]